MSITTLEEQPGTGILRRNLAVYGPGTAGAVALLGVSLASLAGGTLGAIFPAVILALISVAVGIQLVGSIRDLRSEPTFIRGPVRNTWTKHAILVFFRQHFLLLGGEVFTVAATTYAELRPDDVVEIHYWPHTRTVIRVALVSSAHARETEAVDGPLLPVTIPTASSLGQHQR